MVEDSKKSTSVGRPKKSQEEKDFCFAYGQEMRKSIKSAGYSLDEFSMKADMSKEYVSRVCNGEISPSIYQHEKMRNALEKKAVILPPLNDEKDRKKTVDIERKIQEAKEICLQQKQASKELYEKLSEIEKLDLDNKNR